VRFDSFASLSRYHKSFKVYSALPVVFLIGTGLKNIDTKSCYKRAVLLDYKILNLIGIIQLAERYASVKRYILLIYISFYFCNILNPKLNP